MTQKKPARKRYVSPKGTAIWPRLNQPDTKYDADGVYNAKLAFEADDDAANKLIADLTAVREAAFKQYISENPKFKKVAKQVDFFSAELDDEGEETGRTLMNFKMKAKITAKKTGKVYFMKPVIVNAKKVILKNPPNIGGGSQLKVSFEVAPYFNAKDKEFGLSLRLVGVQIIDLVEFGGGSAAANDFDDEDGFDGADGAEESSDDSDDDSDSGDADDSSGDY
ncbi:ssDNA-binding protein [Lysobacter sp. CA199]|uniref:ssDNA-binding protein n=1 Tax=Lysobacter sp. CA199 TaxID=3455608 RepID=UPI003F8D01A5